MSKKWEFNKKDLQRVVRNALIFLSPVVITELTLLQQGELKPHTYFIAFEVWAIGVAVDFFRKLKAGK